MAPDAAMPDLFRNVREKDIGLCFMVEMRRTFFYWVEKIVRVVCDHYGKRARAFGP